MICPAAILRPSIQALLLAGLLAGDLSAATDAALPPDAYPATRYDALAKKSPFSLASTEEVVTAGFADNLILLGAARIGDTRMATLLDRTSSRTFTITGVPGADGIELVDVTDMADPKTATASIKKGGEIARIRFDPMLLTTGGQPGAPGVQPAQPGNPVPPGGITGAPVLVPPRPQSNQLPNSANTPKIGVHGGMPPNASAQPGGAPPAPRPSGRRRIIIPSQPAQTNPAKP